jgi:hypothetical protein
LTKTIIKTIGKEEYAKSIARLDQIGK